MINVDASFGRLDVVYHASSAVCSALLFSPVFRLSLESVLVHPSVCGPENNDPDGKWLLFSSLLGSGTVLSNITLFHIVLCHKILVFACSPTEQELVNCLFNVAGPKSEAHMACSNTNTKAEVI